MSGLNPNVNVTNLMLINLVLGVVLPSLTAVVTHKMAGSNLKALVLLALAAIGGVITQVATSNGNFEWKAALLSFGTAFLFSVATHYGLLKPVGVTGSTGLIQNALPSGINGGSDPAPSPIAVPSKPAVHADNDSNP